MRLERNPQKLLREMSARIKVRDIRHLHELREQIQPKWYESLLLVLLFPAAFGLLFIMIQAVETGRFFAGRDLYVARFFYVWVGLFILGMSAMLEMLLTRLRAVRRMAEELYQQMSEVHKELAGVRGGLEELARMPSPGARDGSDAGAAPPEERDDDA